MGAAIRSAQAATETQKSEDSGRTVRPHVRRAHWRTVVSGKRKDEHGNEISADNRKRELRWLPPSFVNINDDELPAVIRNIK